MLDSFALLSGQINSLIRAIKNEKTPILRNLITLPLLLSPERDEALVVRFFIPMFPLNVACNFNLKLFYRK